MLLRYLKDIKGEMSHVTWPSRRQTIGYSILVIAISIALAVYLGLFDFLFTEGITKLS